MEYLGDYRLAGVVYFSWKSICTGGTVQVYKDDGTTQSTAGITDTRDFDSLTGINNCKIDLDDVFYTAGHDYSVVLAGATIDGDSLNFVLAGFSIENRLTSQILAGDASIDTEATPWQIVVKLKGTDTELIRKDLKDINDDDLTAINTVIASATEP
jgi:hypothetical protein